MGRLGTDGRYCRSARKLEYVRAMHVISKSLYTLRQPINWDTTFTLVMLSESLYLRDVNQAPVSRVDRFD